MTRKRLNFWKEKMDEITEKLGGRRNDMWQDKFVYDIAECLSEILIEMERKDKNNA